MPARVSVGLAIASAAEESKERSRAAFDNVSIERGSPKMTSSIKGLLLRDGSMVVADIRRADDTAVKFQALGREMTVPTSHVARILYRALTEEAASRIPSGRTGVVLSNGDFIDGDVAIRDGNVNVSSVLFGARRFNTYDQTTAVILREAATEPGRSKVRATDGTVVHASGIIIERGKFRVSDGGGNVFSLAEDQVVEITNDDDDDAARDAAGKPAH
jgi:hypothetical protein